MNVISEILKKIDFKTNPLLISILVVLIAARVYYFSGNIFLNLSILLLGIYLLIIFINRCYLSIYQKNEARRYEIDNNRKNTVQQNQVIESIHDYFLELPEQKLQTLVDIFDLPEVGGNKYKRVIQAGSALKQQLSPEDYNIRIDSRRSLVVVKFNYNYDYNSPLVVEFDPTLSRYLSNYIVTGKK